MPIKFRSTTANLLRFATFALVLVTLLPFFSFLIWPLELLSHFYVQYAIIFLGLMVFWAFMRKPYLVVVSVVGFIFSFALVLPFYYKPQVIAQPETNKLNQFSLVFSNFNYGNTDFQALADYVNQEKPMAVALVEIPQDHYQAIKKLLPNYPYSFRQPGVNRHLGLVVLSQKPFTRKPYTHYFGDSKYPALEVNLALKDTPDLSLIIIHPPPPMTPHLKTQRNQVFAGLADYLSKKQVRTIVVGDFNSTSFSPNFRQILDEGKVNDARYGEGVQPSWPTQLPKPLRIPIDHALVTKDIQVINRRLGPNIGSDHLPFSLQVLIP